MERPSIWAIFVLCNSVPFLDHSPWQSLCKQGTRVHRWKLFFGNVCYIQSPSCRCKLVNQFEMDKHWLFSWVISCSKCAKKNSTESLYLFFGCLGVSSIPWFICKKREKYNWVPLFHHAACACSFLNFVFIHLSVISSSAHRGVSARVPDSVPSRSWKPPYFWRYASPCF